jgi:NAD(P)-dependent dehydrogenase (short-subunit alcohol dehydrogenase family)
MKIKESVALVTGANRGLGKAFVQALLAAGAQKIYVGAGTQHSSPIPVSSRSNSTLPIRTTSP